MEFDTCTFVYNEGPSGGALEFGSSIGATCTAVFYDCLIEYNEAYQEGGASGPPKAERRRCRSTIPRSATTSRACTEEESTNTGTTVFLSNTPVHSNSPDNIYSVP